MESIETIPVLCMCRLCLNYSEDCSEITNHEFHSNTRNQIRKYLYIEIKVDDTLPKTVCQPCIDRIRAFDKFACEVENHQQLLQLLQLSKVKYGSNNGTQTISSPTVVSKANGTLIITLQTTAENVINTNNDDIIISKLVNAQSSPLQFSYEATSNKVVLAADEKPSIHVVDEQTIERELDELDATESDNEDQYNEDEVTQDDDNAAATSIYDLKINEKQFKDFPTKFIEDSKLLYRGRHLLDMISKFYKLQCDVCTNDPVVPFDSVSMLCQHYVEVHQIKGYVVCCNVKLIKPRAMALHMARHLQPDAFKCPECNKMLTCPKILQYHIQNHLPESQRPLACLQCPRRFSYSSALVAHTISHQPESERAAHVCDECGKVFASAGRLTTHINVSHMQHGQDYSCDICAKSFACRSNLNYHQTTHQPKVRQVQCSKCGKWLKNNLCLRKHMMQHSSIRYNCTICEYSSLNKQCLTNHMQVQHTNEKPFKCDVCPKSFKLKNTLRNHLVQHTGIKRFICPFCKRSFASSGNFYSHRKRMHPEELAALLLKHEEEERQLREQTKKMK